MLITLTPPTDTNPVGEEHTVTATITDGSENPQEGIVVTFTVISGPNQGDTGEGTTNASGQATFTYTGDGGPGTDQIRACFGDAENKVCSQTVTKVWNQADTPEIVLTPSSDLNLVVDDPTVTAILSPAPADGTTVSFTVISGPNQGDTGTGTTTSGVATWTYTGDGGVGTDQIQACFDDSESTVCSNVVEKEWTEEIISLSPLLAQNELNTQHTLTATIQDLKGNPIVGKTVNFSVKDGPNKGDNGTDTTDGNGEATFTYTGDGGVGTDAIRACFTNAAGQEVCTDYGDDTFDNDAFKEWGDPCPAIKPNPATLPNPVVGVAYSQTMTAFGGEAPYTFEVTDGSLPPGIGLNPTTGVLSGTPTQAGTFDFEITATDTNECPGTRAYTLTVNPGPIPTLSEWGMIMLSVLLIASSLFYLRRRKDTIRSA